MTAYLIRRFLQMILVVLLSTMAIYALLNAAPGGPLSGLKAGSADRRQGVSDRDIERLKAYLGIDKPLILRYMTWLLGDDWLGSDWLSISWGGYKVSDTCRKDKNGNETCDYVRFWADPGVAQLRPAYPIWVEGNVSGEFVAAPNIKVQPIGDLPKDWVEGTLVENQGDKIVVDYANGGQATLVLPANVTIDYPREGPESMGPGDRLWFKVIRVEEVAATSVEAKPKGKPASDAIIVAEVLKIDGPTIWAQSTGGSKEYTILTTADTKFDIPGAAPRPEDGTWLDVGWLFNPYRGILGPYAGFHGEQHGVLRLDWGVSWKIAPQQPVTNLIESRLTNTIILMTAATVLSLAVAVPIGIVSAVKQYSILDYIATTFSFFGSAMPVFWFGLMMILLFSYEFREWGLPFMPTGGVVSVGRIEPGNVLSYLNTEPGSVVDRIVHLIMPTIVLSLLYMAGWSRFTRSSMLEVLRQDYIRTARAKGLRERVVLSKHALRNALIPLITIVVFQLPGIFGGAIITETIFGYHGMGRLYFDALNTADWPVAMVLLMITSILVVVATLLGDILYTIVDPRIRLE
jgi:peptide/nickel transport system permease protein